MYDADAYAPCRYHLIQRAKAQPTLLSPTTTASAASSLPLPGTASRWRMSADVTGLDRHAHMLRRVDDMYQAYTLYYFLQVWRERMTEPGWGWSVPSPARRSYSLSICLSVYLSICLSVYLSEACACLLLM